MNVSDANIQSGFEYILQLRQIPLRILLGLGHDHRVSVRNSSEAINTLYYRISSLISIIPIPVLISIVPIPVQLSYLLILYGNRYEISHRFELKDSGYSRPPRALKFFDDFECLAFLYQNYLPKFWYWEIVETYRRLILTAVLTVVSNNEDSKVGRVPSLRNCLLHCLNHFLVFLISR